MASSSEVAVPGVPTQRQLRLSTVEHAGSTLVIATRSASGFAGGVASAVPSAANERAQGHIQRIRIIHRSRCSTVEVSLMDPAT